jgi:general secretion pathway protein E
MTAAAVPAPEIFLPETVQAAHRMAARTGRPAVQVLEEELRLEPRRFVEALGAALHYVVVDMAQLRGMSAAFDAVSFADAVRRQCLPMRDAAGAMVLVIGDPFDADLQAWAQVRVEEPFTWRLAHRADVAAYLSGHEETLRATDGVLAGAPTAATAAAAMADICLKTISEDTSPVVKLVDSTLYDALGESASDIHLETTADGMRIRYRIDGVLTPIGSIGGVELADQVVSRVKIMSELDIAERRIPQDGRFKVSVRGREVDFRVSVMPSIFGEDAVLRILDKRALSEELNGLRLESLGFDGATLAQLRRLAHEAYGMLLVTGPTGSGKTTTLYAAVSEINDGRDKIVTIEDPVEYQLPNVLQIPVNEKKGLTFGRGLRSILRHDPDKIMVGEIRDQETAQIAVQSALTGHLVFTTVHANNALDVLARFTHMGVDPYSLVSALNGIVAQRLVRISCPHCREAVTPDPRLLAESGIDAQAAAGMSFLAGRGCGQCRGTGYRGRRAVGEVLCLNDELREAITTRQPLRVIRDAAARSGTRFLRGVALDLVARGETTLTEVNRVTLAM